MTTFLFLVKYDHEGVVLDDCLDLSQAEAAGDGDIHALFIAEKVAERLGQPFDLKLKDLVHAVQMIGLRSRLDGATEGPYLVRTEVDITREQFQSVLRDNPELFKRIREEGAVGASLPVPTSR